MRIFKKSLIAFLTIFMIVLSSVPAYAQDKATVNIPVRSSYTGTKVNGTEGITYTLKADDNAFPMPEGSVDGQKSIIVNVQKAASDAGAEEVYFGETVFPKVGIYSYTIYQVNGNDEKCIYDSTVYNLTVTVINSKGGGLEAIPYFTRPDSEYKWARPEFINQYFSESSGLSVVKEANRGTADIGDEILYEITVTNNGTEKVQGIRIRDYIPKYTLFKKINDGYGVFGSIEDRDHVTWFITELEAGESITLSFTVLVDECMPANASIENTAQYEVTGNTVPIPPNDPKDPSNSTNGIDTPKPGNAPKTGDDNNINMYVLLILISSVSLLGCSILKKTK